MNVLSMLSSLSADWESMGGIVDNLARGQLEMSLSPLAPESLYRELGSAVPSGASLLILRNKAETSTY